MNLKYFKNIGENEYEILIHGEIGKVVIGSDIAAEIHMLNRMGATLIRERINTVGGTVTDAYSIVSANLASTATIHTINEGIADSSGSWILASGNKRSGFDFSTVFLHNPSYKGKSIEDVQDSRLKNELVLMRDSIITILANNTNKTKEEIQNVMDANTRLSAKESKEFGIIDEVLPSKRTPELVENMSMADIMNVCHELNNDNSKINNNMEVKDLENKVENLSGQITAKDERISTLENSVSEKDAKITEVENKVSEKDEEIQGLKNKVQEFETAQIKNAVKSALDSGKFTEDAEDKLTNQCAAMGIENFNEMIDMVKLPQANVINQINNNSGNQGTKETKDQKLANKYQELAENNPIELKRIKNESPKQFEEMFNAWNEA